MCVVNSESITVVMVRISEKYNNTLFGQVEEDTDTANAGNRAVCCNIDSINLVLVKMMI